MLVWCERRVQPIEVPLAVAVAISLLLSPHVLTHDLSLILVPLAVCWKYRAASIRRLPLVLVGAYALLVVGFFLSLFVPFQLDAGAGLIILSVLLGETAHLHDIRPRVVGAAVAR